ncbi:MAG TPA: carboxypeptidase regulatory-like domain-containing protein [Egibacteraceae bacterium]|jgi:5-hydroxyisourate hydrolase-like protein (transthyretin family)|nr:carboxypeptidase regulatory-like domain-containing protein [Egibacteraceae bacterium]
MEQRISGVRRLGVAGLTVALLLAWLVTTAPAADAFGSSQPAPLPAVSAGGYMTCALTADGRAVCWGENQGLSGDVNTGNGMATPPADVRFKEVNAGYGVACGVTTADAVVCWGNDNFNKVSQVPAGTYTHVAPGLNFICALRTDQGITCWGGDTVDTDHKVVRDAPTTGAYTQLAMGIRHACALRSDGTVVCWGHNTGTEGQTIVPPGVYRYVTSGNFTNCAIRTTSDALDGSVVCWGRNNGSQVTTVPAGAFATVNAGFGHVCGLRPDSTVTCWGRSTEGQTATPPGTFTYVTAGTFHTCAMSTAGPPALCWGSNNAAPSTHMGRVQPILSNAPPPAGTLGESYSYQLPMVTHVSPAPTFTQTAGDLPPGVTLNPQGLLSGTPTQTGDYTFTVAASSLGMSPPDCPMGATGSLSCTFGDPTSVATATRVFTIGVTEAPPGAITGQVTGADTGAPLANATVTARFPGGTQAGQATTDSGGNYTIPDLVAGDYTVTAAATGYVTSAPRATSVTSGQTTTVDIRLEREQRPTVVGVWNNHWETVTDGLFVEWSENIRANPARPIPWADYTIHERPDCSDSAIAHGQPNQAGGNWTPQRPTIRDLVVEGWGKVTPGGTYYLRVAPNVEFGTVSQLSNDLVPCFQFVSQLRPVDDSAVAGLVTSTATGAPIAGATVTVTRTQGLPGSVAGQGTTDANGQYRIEQLAPGPYNITASASGYKARTETSVGLQGGQTRTVHFALQPGGITGTVTDSRNGSPIAGATVTKVAADGSQSTTTTGADGKYTFLAVPAGQYTVKAAADQYQPAQATATVTDGEMTTVNFALRPGSTPPAKPSDPKPPKPPRPR